MIENEIKNLKEKLDILKKEGYISTLNKTSARNLLYEILDVKKNYKDIDIRIKNNLTTNYVTIFNATPEGKEKDQIKRIRDKYGYAESFKNRKKVFKASIQGNSSKFINGKLFKLAVDYNNMRVYLGVYNKDYDLIDCKSYWTFQGLKNNFQKRLKWLFWIKTWEKEENKKILYKYYDYGIYKLINFEEFLKLLENGIVRVSFRINTYKNGAKKGKIDDRGTSFEIQELDLEKLYQKVK